MAKLEPIFQVSEFNEFINTYLNEIGEVIVEGEISQINLSQNKWLFITIKDKKSSVELFGTTFQLSGHDLLEEGMLVHVYGNPRLYEKTGKFSIFANEIKPAGEGSLKLALEKLEKKLKQEGLFDQERKRKIPRFPQKIGLITAKDSMAYSDFVKVLSERMGGIKIYFYPAQVQGRSSSSSIISAFEFFNSNIPNLDLLVLTRGGGSLEDLMSFNDEKVARAIFSSKIPVVCGIGHEEDTSLADKVADLRASTPSNAAELVVRDKKEVAKEISYFINTIETSIKNKIALQRTQTLNLISNIKSEVLKQAKDLRNTIEKFRSQFNLFIEKLSALKTQTNNLKNTIDIKTHTLISEYKNQVKSLKRILKNLDPKNVLKRGFSITKKDGAIIRSKKDILKKDKIITIISDGKIISEVK